MKTTALLTTSLENYPKRTGKVRDLYELSDSLLMVATDRISAYDVVMPNGIPDKGRVLTQISVFWFGLLGDTAKHHLLSADVKDLPEELQTMEELDGRIMLCRKAQVVPIECIVRGYLAGGGWRDYKKSGKVCGIELAGGLKQASKLPEPIFTPSTKADQGHDENISFDEASGLVGAELMNELRDKSIAIYQRAAEYAAERGIILADTKFEWGRDENGDIILIDEILTPDSSRFWPADGYSPGKSQPSFDKQFVRDYLDKVKFDRTPPGPPLPTEIVQQTRAKYIEAYTSLTGRDFAWE
jgi:phosphoribosylaminoimidazole-succinocarboxamide synthase